MRPGAVTLCLMLGVFTAFAQTDRGTITGTVADPSGAVVANAPIEARNVETGQVYPATSTATGNYTIAQLPAGAYELTVNVQGFKKYIRRGLDLAPTQIIRADIALDVGSPTDAVTITAEAPLLKTESGEVAQNVTVSQLNNLPILGIGETTASAAGVRNPWALSLLVPGTQYSVGGIFGGVPNIVVNGAQANTASYRVEGMDAGNNGTLVVFTMEVQPSAEAIQEVAVQTSNFAAEYGQVGGGLFNATMKSGTNQFHGSLYDYNVNEDYNSRQPYTGLLNKARRNDYGGSLGGPVRIPKLYDGRNRTFFYWNFEQYRESQVVSTTTVTVPVADYRNGDFSKVIPGSGNLLLKVGGANYVDPLGRTTLAGTIFDPLTERPMVAGGQTVIVRDPFLGNKIDPTRFDKVAMNIQNLIPAPAGPNAAQLGSNFNSPQKSHRTTEIPSLKLDQTIGKGHLAFYWSTTTTANQFPIVGSPAAPEGFPATITTAIGNFDNSYVMRLNYDHSITPTLLGHIGVGYQNNKLYDDAPDITFNPTTQLGLKGPFLNRNFPTITIGATTATGGMSNMGPLFQTHQYVEKPAANLSLSWVRQNHTYKFGSEWRIEGNPQVSHAQPPWNNDGAFTFGAAATTQTSLQGLALSQGSAGFGYASFLLGKVTTFDLGVPAVYRFGKQQWALFLQDSWKVTRKITLDYGVRWDYGTYPTETYGRIASFGAQVPNPSAGNHAGGVIYEATCKCKFARNYPYGIGPRIGVAYQVLPRTVLRGGIGLVYNVTNVAASTPLSYQDGGIPGFGQALFQLQDGVPSNILPTFPNFSPGALPLPNTVGGAPVFLDQNAGRPARQIQWSLGVQREITRNLAVDATYVGNRGVWWNAGALAPNNSMSQQLLTNYGFTIGNLTDAALLQTQIGNLTTPQKAVLAARGIGLPYAGFPSNQTVFQSLLLYPQYSGNISPTSAPLGKTWYDSLQTTVTERVSHGLSLNANFTWSKNLDLMSSPDLFNRNLGKNYSINDLPIQFRMSAQYVTPAPHNGLLGKNKVVSQVLGGWGIGWYSQYQSAPILALPASAGANGINKWLGRGPGPAQLVAGQSLWSTDWVDLSGTHHTDPIDINCHCFDPTKTVVLNRNAWQNVPDGQWATNLSTIRNFRGFRYPTENANVSRDFRFKEGRISLNVRAEFTNVFNRTRLPQPSTVGFTANPTLSPTTGLYTGGFGTVVPTTGTAGARAGTLVARLLF